MTSGYLMETGQQAALCQNSPLDLRIGIFAL
jgi:hypothetical protein